MNMKRLKKLPEFIRFIMVGVFATALHYGLYFIFQRFINVNIAYSIGYILSFIANFYLTALFTFGKKPSWKKAFGFGGAHLINYILHAFDTGRSTQSRRSVSLGRRIGALPETPMLRCYGNVQG